MVPRCSFILLFHFIVITAAIEGFKVEGEIGHPWPHPNHYDHYDVDEADFPTYEMGNTAYTDAEDSRVKKGESSAKSKYNPSLKWIGLGKRNPNPVWSLEVLSEMQKFFDNVKRHLSRREISNGKKLDQYFRSAPKNSHQNSVTRRQHFYNPSLMWTGLGKK